LDKVRKRPIIEKEGGTATAEQQHRGRIEKKKSRIQAREKQKRNIWGPREERVKNGPYHDKPYRSYMAARKRETIGRS